MTCSNPQRTGVSALAFVCAVVVVFPALSQAADLTFSGEITEVVAPPPPPFEGVAVGDSWTLSFSFDETTVDIDSSLTAGNYPESVATMTLAVGGARVSGAPAGALQNSGTSVIAVNLGEDFADYTVMVGVPAGDGWAQVALWDNDGTPFLSDALPLQIPEPMETAFPDLRDFFLRLPGSSEVYLRGVVGDLSPPVRAGTHTQVRSDLVLRFDDLGGRYLDLVWDGNGVASGLFGCPGCEVMGVEPSPFRWSARDVTGAPPAVGEAVLTINLDNPGGEVMGTEPSPFRVLLDCGDGCSGELDFSAATAAFPGPLGSLVLDGVRIALDEGTTVALEGFDVYDAIDKVKLVGTRFDRFIELSQTTDPDRVDLLAASDDTASGIAATGELLCPGCEVMGVEPSPFKWLAFDENSIPAVDGEAVIGFYLDPAGEVMGVEPSPFKVALSIDGSILAELDFGGVSGAFPQALGSLSLGNLRLLLPDDSTLPVEVLDLYDEDDTLTLVDTRVDLRVIERVDLDERQVDLVVNSTRFGAGGFASGMITCPGCEVMGVEPSPFRWAVDPATGIVVDGEAAVSYISDLGSDRMGIEPSPFRYLVVGDDGVVLGGLDLSDSEGVWGSFHLEGVEVGLADGSKIEVQSFETFDVLTVEIDVKPGCDANTINLGSAGVIPVAILSSAGFDATTVDPATITVAGASIKLVGNGKRYLAQPEDVNGDGLDDLMCHVVTEELELEVGDSVVVLEASTFDGTNIAGQDFIRIVPD